MIKIEGGTDFDLQVLEVPSAPAGASGGTISSSSGGGGADGKGGGSGNVSGQTGPESAARRLAESSEVNEPEKVRVKLVLLFGDQ